MLFLLTFCKNIVPPYPELIIGMMTNSVNPFKHPNLFENSNPFKNSNPFMGPATTNTNPTIGNSPFSNVIPKHVINPFSQSTTPSNIPVQMAPSQAIPTIQISTRVATVSTVSPSYRILTVVGSSVAKPSQSELQDIALSAFTCEISESVKLCIRPNLSPTMIEGLTRGGVAARSDLAKATNIKAISPCELAAKHDVVVMVSIVQNSVGFYNEFTIALPPAQNIMQQNTIVPVEIKIVAANFNKTIRDVTTDEIKAFLGIVDGATISPIDPKQKQAEMMFVITKESFIRVMNAINRVDNSANLDFDKNTCAEFVSVLQRETVNPLVCSIKFECP
jgi:hypothetical protein